MREEWVICKPSPKWGAAGILKYLCTIPAPCSELSLSVAQTQPPISENVRVNFGGNSSWPPLQLSESNCSKPCFIVAHGKLTTGSGGTHKAACSWLAFSSLKSGIWAGMSFLSPTPLSLKQMQLRALLPWKPSAYGMRLISTDISSSKNQWEIWKQMWNIQRLRSL